MKEELQRIEAGLMAARLDLAAANKQLEFLVASEQDKEKRIRLLETRVNYAMGIAVVLSFLGPVAVHAVFKI